MPTWVTKISPSYRVNQVKQWQLSLIYVLQDLRGWGYLNTFVIAWNVQGPASAHEENLQLDEHSVAKACFFFFKHVRKVRAHGGPIGGPLLSL